MTALIHTALRPKLNPSGLRNLRQEGRLPGVVFGRHADNRHIHISTGDFKRWLKQGGSGFIQLNLEGEQPLTVMLEDLQRNPVTRELLHVDFQLVQTDGIIRTKLPVKFTGTPNGTRYGGVVQIQDPYVEVEALPQHLPATVEVDISAMEIGETIFVRDVPFADEVTVISGPNEILLSVLKH